MQRVLDLDLDFFVQPVVFEVPRDGQRPKSADYELGLDLDTTLLSIDVDTSGPLDTAIHYLRERALLSDSLPGAAVEHHDEVFTHWQEMIDNGVLCPPFHVTHMDAHGDFGYGQAGHRHVFDVLRLPLEERPARSRELLNYGDYLVHAVACRWIDAIDYVYCPGGGCDIHAAYWENFGAPNWYERASGTLRLSALDEAAFNRFATSQQGPPPERYAEPRVPFEGIQQRKYEAAQPFDFVFLSRSPQYVPDTADPLYDAIRAAFVAEP